MIIPHYYEEPHMLHENTMPNRAYYVPSSKRMDNLIEHREQSDRLQSLNGNWKFRYYKSIYDLQDEFYKTDYPVEEYDTVPVPGVWQGAGALRKTSGILMVHCRIMHRSSSFP